MGGKQTRMAKSPAIERVRHLAKRSSNVISKKDGEVLRKSQSVSQLFVSRLLPRVPGLGSF